MVREFDQLDLICVQASLQEVGGQVRGIIICDKLAANQGAIIHVSRDQLKEISIGGNV